MSDSSPLPPVRLHPEAELARAALSTPVLSRAARLARWAGPDTRVDAGGGLAEEQLPAAAELLGLTGDDAAAYASEAWRVAVDTGLVEIVDEEAGTVRAGDELKLLTGGSPQDVLTVWLAALETVIADAAVPDLDDLVDALDEGGEVDFSSLDWDPEGEAEFLDGVLGNLYLLTVSEDGSGESPVPLPALAASVIVPDDMGEPTNDVLEQVSDAMMRLDDQFRALEPIGLVAYRPVDEALMADADEEPAAPVDDTDVSPLRHGPAHPARRLRAAGAAAGGRLRGTGRRGAGRQGRGRAARRHRPVRPVRRPRRDRAVARPPGNRSPRHGSCSRRPVARTPAPRCAGCAVSRRCRWWAWRAEPALREVLDDPELGGLARVWLSERGAAGVPAPPEEMVFWLTVDTLAAQLAAEGNSEELRALVEGLAAQHSGFFAAAWRVEHPATAEVLDAMGRLHPDKKVAKEARKAAFKARSQQAG